MSSTATRTSASLPTNALQAHALLLLEGLSALLRRTRPSEAYAAALPPGRRFPLARGAFASVLVPLTVLSLLVDLPLATFFLHLNAPAAWRLPLHAALLALELWMLAWAVGVRSATQRVAHVLAEGELVIAVALRPPVRVPLAGIVAAHVVKGAPSHWLEARGLARRDVAFHAAIDPPTLLLELVPQAGGPRGLALQVDDPDGLRRALARPGQS